MATLEDLESKGYTVTLARPAVYFVEGNGLSTYVSTEDQDQIDALAVNPVPAPDLSDMTKDDLYALAQEADIEGRSNMSKDELVSALSAP